ncbi:MAG: transporter [bacterium]|nr:MAG: transporter [bacterium]
MDEIEGIMKKLIPAMFILFAILLSACGSKDKTHHSLESLSNEKLTVFLLWNDKEINLKKNEIQRLRKLKVIDLRGTPISEKDIAKLKKWFPKTILLFTWLDWFTYITRQIADMLWGMPSIIILVGTGVYLTIRFKFPQGRGFRHAIQLVAGKYDEKDDPGEVSHFQALSTALSATVGTGNIAGVATAIAVGGPGAIFWMWITALVGMATKYASCTLALKYRDIGPDGQISGGPMYTIQKALNMPKLAYLFAGLALLASFGIGNMVQANSVVDGLKVAIPILGEPEMASYKYYVGSFLALGVGLVILGGVRRIARVASYIVPLMAIIYCGAALLILIANVNQIPEAFKTIFYLAFNPLSAVGGVAGIAVTTAIQKGVARGVFSNEAGLGSAPMAHAVAKTKEPVREGLVAMLEPFIDTIVICTMTALVIVIVGAWGINKPDGMTGSALSAYSFKLGFSGVLGDEFARIGAWIVGFGLVFFAYSTIIAWSYYGDRSAEYLFGKKAVLPYRMVYTIVVVVGASIPVHLVWNLADIANIFMALPNLVSLILLASLVKKMGEDYFKRT